jgi:hypothetical protein
VLDPLVDGEDREIAGARQAPGVVHRAEVAQDGGGAVRVDEDLVEVVRAGKGEVFGGEGRRHVVEEGRRFVTE